MEFPANSHKSTEKAEASKKEKKVKRIELQGQVVKKKEPLSHKVKGIFFGGQFRQTAQYVAADVLLPAFRDLIVNSISKGVDRLVYGDNAPRRMVQGSSQYRPRVQYNSPIIRQQDPRERDVILPGQPPRDISGKRPGEIFIFSAREDAEAMLEGLGTIIDDYEIATLADLYEMMGLPHTHVDNTWGWTSIVRAEVRQSRDGYILELPPLQSIK